MPTWPKIEALIPVVLFTPILKKKYCNVVLNTPKIVIRSICFMLILKRGALVKIPNINNIRPAKKKRMLMKVMVPAKSLLAIPISA